MSERKTKQKKILTEYLEKNANKHIRIQEIYEDLKEVIGLTTVYRIINDLIKNKNIIKIPLENKQGFCYQYNKQHIGCLDHYHLICEECGKLLHFENNNISQIINEAAKNEKFAINKNKIAFYGKCKECEKNRRDNEKI